MDIPSSCQLYEGRRRGWRRRRKNQQSSPASSLLYVAITRQVRIPMHYFPANDLSINANQYGSIGRLILGVCAPTRN